MVFGDHSGCSLWSAWVWEETRSACCRDPQVRVEGILPQVSAVQVERRTDLGDRFWRWN